MGDAAIHLTEALLKYVHHALTEVESEEVARHLGDCADCCKLVADVGLAADTLAALARQALIEGHITVDDLARYHWGGLTDEARTQVEEHVLTCARCHDELERIREVDLASGAEPAPMPASVRRQIRDIVSPPQGKPVFDRVRVKIAKSMIFVLESSTQVQFPEPAAVRSSRGAEYRNTLELVRAVTPRDGISLTIRLIVVEHEESLTQDLYLEVTPYKLGLSYSVHDSRRRGAGNFPLKQGKTRIRSVERPDSYFVDISEDGESLARFQLDLLSFTLSECLESATGYMKQERYAEALDVLGCAIQRYPNSVDAWETYALAQAVIGRDPDKLFEQYQQWQRPAVRSAIKQEAAREIDRAIAAIEKAARDATKDLLIRLARLLAGQAGADDRAAIPALAEAAPLSPTALGFILAIGPKLAAVNGGVLSTLGQRNEPLDGLPERLANEVQIARKPLTVEELDELLDAKFHSLSERLEARLLEATKPNAIRLTDYEHALWAASGQTWEKLPRGVRDLLVNGEFLYWLYRRTDDRADVLDWSPACVELFRALEVILNTQLQEVLLQLLLFVHAKPDRLAWLARNFSRALDMLARKQKYRGGSHSPREIVTMLKILRQAGHEGLSGFPAVLDEFVHNRQALTEPLFLELINQSVGAFRNGSLHSDRFLRAEDARIARKVVFGLDEDRIGSRPVHQWFEEEDDRFLPRAAKKSLIADLEQKWPDYPGLIGIIVS